jgi:DNA mismatch endonuclease, patch repair protein
MKAVRSSGNLSTELAAIRLFRKLKITGWRRNSSLQGKPDFVFSNSRTVVFIDGCFWHGCPKCYRAPKSNEAYWQAKIRRNCIRDATVDSELKKQGWKVVRIWEHSFKDGSKLEKLLLRELLPPIPYAFPA